MSSTFGVASTSLDLALSPKDAADPTSSTFGFVSSPVGLLSSSRVTLYFGSTAASRSETFGVVSTNFGEALSPEDTADPASSTFGFVSSTVGLLSSSRVTLYFASTAASRSETFGVVSISFGLALSPEDPADPASSTFGFVSSTVG